MIRRLPAAEAPTVLFSGGGTVGHLAPGFALASKLRAHGVRCVFATPGEASEAEWFGGRIHPRVVPAPRLPKTAKAGIAFAPRMILGISRALGLIRREHVNAVVALGGWPCVPAAVAAWISRTPLAFVVADAVPGVVVKHLQGLAGRIYVPVASAAAALAPDAPVVVTGPLVRPELLEGRRDPAAFGLDPAKRTLLVLGGSLGARGLFERWRLGLEAVVVRDPSLIDRLQVIHSIGGQGDRVRETYDRLGLTYHLTTFIHDMGTAYHTADLVLARSGASTCAELLATRTPAVLVPYPHHADRQQFENAALLVDAGGAIQIEETDLDHVAVANEVIARILDDDELARMRTALSGGTSDGLGKTVHDLVRFIGLEGDVRAPATSS